MSNIFCIKCGKNLPVNSNYCPNCGASQQTDDSIYHLSQKERLSLLLQFKLVKNIGSKSEQPFYDELIEILENGYSKQYNKMYNIIPFSEMTVSECEEVEQILNMYDCIINSFKKLQKSGQVAKIGESEIAFPGFDGNNESKQLSYAKFILKQGDVETINEYNRGDLNCHCSIIDKYRKMLKKWSIMKERNKQDHCLSEEDILQLVNTY